MKIKRLAASFGALTGERLAFGAGMTVIEAPNEWGKSTWCAFIRAMLYGIHTAERGSAGFLPEKTKYRPWSGGAMEGMMEVEFENRSIAIQRTALGASPMKKLDVRYADSGLEVAALLHENLGETLTGVPEGVFVRSAFIRQSELSVAQTGSLEQRINALVTAGEEGVSFTDTTNNLRAQMRKRRHNRTGEIPALESQITDLDRRMDELRTATSHFNETAAALDAVITRRAELAAQLDAYTELSRRAERAKIAEAFKKQQALDWERRSLQKQFTQSGSDVSREELTFALEKQDHLSALTAQYSEIKAARESAEKDLALMEEERLRSGFAGCTAAEAQELTARAKTEIAEAADAGNFRQQKYTIPLAVLLVLTFGSIALSIPFALPLYWGGIGTAFGALLLGILLLRQRRRMNAATAKQQATFARLQVTRPEEIDTALAGYEQLCQKVAELQVTLGKTNRLHTSVTEEMRRGTTEYQTAVTAFAPEVTTLTAAHQTMKTLSDLVGRIDNADAEYKANAKVLEALMENYEGDPRETIPQDGLQLPQKPRSELAYEHKRLDREVAALKDSLAYATAEARAIGDPLVLGAARGELTDKTAELERQFAALQLAVTVLDEADAEISARFSPLLAQRAGLYLDRLTDGQYKRVLFDKTLTPSAERMGEAVSRDILYLSGGTAEQIYLSLRLAICDLAFPPKSNCPIILDDALVHFDQKRMEYALILLKELSANRQIILFSCQKRETEFFKHDDEITIIRN